MIKKLRLYLIISIISLHCSLPSVAMWGDSQWERAYSGSRSPTGSPPRQSRSLLDGVCASVLKVSEELERECVKYKLAKEYMTFNSQEAKDYFLKTNIIKMENLSNEKEIKDFIANWEKK